MKRYLGRAIAVCWAGALLSSSVLLAQTGDWSVTGADGGQSGWQKGEVNISTQSAPGSFKYLWKIQLGKPSNGGNSFSEPLLATRLINAQGFKDIVFWSSGDTLYAVDSELGDLLWKKEFEVKAASSGCGSSSLGLVIEPPPVINFKARRARGVPRSPDAEPLESGERRIGVAAGGGYFGLKGIYVLAPDGMLHEQVLTTGADFAPPVNYLPSANASPLGLSIQGKSIYAATGRDCGGAPNAVWTIDIGLPEYPVASYRMQQVKPLTLTGPTFGADGTAYIFTGSGTSDAAAGVYANSVVALGQDMKPTDWFTPKAAPANIQYVTPVTFTYKGRSLAVAPGEDGSFVLLDAASLGGADHHTPLAQTPSFSKAGEKHGWDGFGTWEDKDGVTWVFASVSAGITAKGDAARLNGVTPHGGIVAFKVVEADGKLSLTPAWISRDMTNPAPPAIANGVVVALSGGDAATPAKLYALDAATGAEIYSSKETIPTYTSLSGVSIGDGHAFFTDHAGVLYSFGIAIEH